MRVLKRPMFRKGGSTGEGIMTGLVDRTKHSDDPFVTGIGKRADPLQVDFESLLRRATPKARIPIGEIGLNLASGDFAGEGFLRNLLGSARKPLTQFTRADDAREAAIKGGAAKLAINQAMAERTALIKNKLRNLPYRDKIRYLMEKLQMTEAEAIRYAETSKTDYTKGTREDKIQEAEKSIMGANKRAKAQYKVDYEAKIPIAKRGGKFIQSRDKKFPKNAFQGGVYFDVQTGILYEFKGGDPNNINNYEDVTKDYK